MVCKMTSSHVLRELERVTYLANANDPFSKLIGYIVME